MTDAALRTDRTAPPAHAGGVDRRRRRLGTAALVTLALGWALIMQSLGWAQTSYFALVKSLGDGTAQIDRYHWETRDKSYTNGHFFSVKAPGLPLLLLPAWKAIDAVGGPKLAREAADNARRHGARQWTYHGLNVATYGYSASRAAVMKRRLEIQAPLIWALGLLGTVLPALALLLLVRRVAERLQPGLGTATALTLGTGTLIMPFAVQLFGHVLASLLAFAAFALLWHERDGPARLTRVAVAGLLCGLAVTTEYPFAIVGAIIGLYGVLRPDAMGAGARALLTRAGVFTAGVLAGLLPLLVYNLWAFGSVTTTSYANAVDRQGFSGHDTLGLNSGGFFGIGWPDPRVALELLISPRGLLALTPVVAMGFIGTLLLYRRGRRAEAWTIAALVLALFVYDTGYWLPFGGGSPGPRFLIPMLPFIAIGFAESWRRLPATTLVLATCSFVVMAVGTLTYPLIGTGSLWQWWSRLKHDNFQHTLVAVFGGGNGWVALLPVLLALAAALTLGALATGPIPVRRDLRIAVGALTGWALLALVLGPAFGERMILGVGSTAKGAVDHHGLSAQIVWGAVIAAALALALADWRSRRAQAPEPSAVEVVDHERAPALAAQA